MAVYYKFKSARDFDSIAMAAPFISVGTFKQKIFESKHLGSGTDFDLLPEDTEWDEFGNDLYSTPEVLPVQSSNPVHNALPTNKADEENMIKALINTPSLVWQRCMIVNCFLNNHIVLETSVENKREKKPLSAKEECPDVNEKANDVKVAIPPQQALEKVKFVKPADASEATLESMSVKKHASQGIAPLAEEELQQKVASGEAGKKKKVRLLSNGLHWKPHQDLAAENYMVSMGPSAYNSYWTGMHPGIDGFMGPYAGGMHYMGGYGLGPMDMPFGGVMPPDPFGAQGYMFPPVPLQRAFHNSEVSYGSCSQPGVGGSLLSYLSLTPYIWEKRDIHLWSDKLWSECLIEILLYLEWLENQRGSERDLSRGREFSGEKPTSQMFGSDQLSFRDHEAPPRLEKRKPEQHHQRDHHRFESSKLGTTSTTATEATDKSQKSSVFSHISFVEEQSKKRRLPSDAPASSGHHKSNSNGYYDDYKTSLSDTKAISGTSSGGRKNNRSDAVD
ncbi:DWNN domain isoform 2 [Hibiscus syriacus]|uniref:DWNN domain isoform 2 n=1 Tax=Hibiscus syriacus TaxID=106335 RepID=A0A6A2Y411_HIBSY|nr:DWNN domain isoform 2 [Hibiscus syriacus]